MGSRRSGGDLMVIAGDGAAVSFSGVGSEVRMRCWK